MSCFMPPSSPMAGARSMALLLSGHIQPCSEHLLGHRWQGGAALGRERGLLQRVLREVVAGVADLPANVVKFHRPREDPEGLRRAIADISAVAEDHPAVRGEVAQQARAPEA